MNGSLLQLEDVRLSYGAIDAVRDVTLTVDEAEVVSLLGANGAGKSSILAGITGLRKISGGAVRFAGEDLAGLRPEEIVNRGIALVPEGRRMFGALTVEQNLRLGAVTLKGGGEYRDRHEYVMGLFPKLHDRRAQKAGTLSGGEQQMLAIGRALMSNPKMLLLDEPSLGLAPIVVGQVFELIAELRAEKITMLLVEQNANRALEIADRGYVLAHGRVEREASAAELRTSSETLRDLYLGGSNN